MKIVWPKYIVHTDIHNSCLFQQSETKQISGNFALWSRLLDTQFRLIIFEIIKISFKEINLKCWLKSVLLFCSGLDMLIYK